MTSPKNDTLEILQGANFAELKSFIIAVTGLSYYLAKDEDLASRIARRLTTIGFMDNASYLKLIASSTAAGSELDLLIGELTIGETYFFRHTEQFDALRQIILPHLLKKNLERKRLTIWCAGCSTGAEPYSISILLRRELKIQAPEWSVQILGTDINRGFLDRAAKGMFDEWHLRSVKDELKRSCFKKVDKSWEINSEYKEGVSFIHHNLITGYYPPRFDGPEPFDLILCRNVMIYFNQDTVAEILPKFDRCLAASGWLLLGYSEININLYKAFDLIPYPGALIFQKKKPTKEQFSAPVLPILQQFPALSHADTPPIATTPCLPLQIDTNDSYLKCRRMINTGDLKGALLAADDLILKDQLDARAYFLRGLALLQLGKDQDAEQALRKAIYLDRNFIIAHYHLGLIYLKLQQADKARRYLTNASTLLADKSMDSVLVEGDGMTALQLTNILKTIGEAA
ncbi:MAG TPA: CheR family methyltransferase [Oligoflexus sp.]|uniref:CheR family methyltransferase n=1 Tax=Oligoflexus sp. TaxID=1971216 RepID=UPI002D5BEE9F|nr:CheR family methyltransferase [Oligoflexus sp.]HYX40036.1 CheR family methyltransferase [Oligoflexus sp.]